MSKKNNTKVNKRKTYLQATENSVGTEMFKHMYASVDGGPEQDILKNGELSCAFYVSSVLVMFDLIQEPHTTVESTIKELREAGWQEVPDLESADPGAVIVWGGLNTAMDHTNISDFTLVAIKRLAIVGTRGHQPVIMLHLGLMTLEGQAEK